MVEKKNQFRGQSYKAFYDRNLRMDQIGQVSISLTFYEQLLRQNPFVKKLQTQIVST